MTHSAVSHVETPKPVGVQDFLDGTFSSLRDGGAIVLASVPAPVAPLEVVLQAAPSEDAFLWHPPEGPSFAALSAVETVRGEGAPRFSSIRRRANELWASVAHVSQGEPPPSPRAFGGFSFEPGSASGAPWSAFGDAHFVLPRFTYSRLRDRAWLTVGLRADEQRQRASVLGRVDALLTALRSASARPVDVASKAAPRNVLERTETSPGEWHDLVELVRSRIGRGDFEKVVVARRTALRFSAPVDIGDVLSELARFADDSTRFAVRRGGTTFLGATPERLVRRKGLDVDTEALAGSSRPGETARVAELLASAKERLEHEPVLREIVARLSPLCASLDYPAEPEVRVLRHILHLRTPIRGRLSRPTHVLDLVEKLHPTPAVGGVPTRDAVRFIIEHEPAPRGWYASPVGWFDADGDGEFAVALRSGVVDDCRAYLYAGGGIVKDSDPSSEYAETRLKLAVLSAALRVPQ